MTDSSYPLKLVGVIGGASFLSLVKGWAIEYLLMEWHVHALGCPRLFKVPKSRHGTRLSLLVSRMVALLFADLAGTTYSTSGNQIAGNIFLLAHSQKC